MPFTTRTKIILGGAVAAVIIVVVVVVVLLNKAKSTAVNFDTDTNSFAIDDPYTCLTGQGASGGVSQVYTDATTPEQCKQYCTDLGEGCLAVDYMTKQESIDSQTVEKSINCRIYETDQTPRIGNAGVDERMYCYQNENMNPYASCSARSGAIVITEDDVSEVTKSVPGKCAATAYPKTGNGWHADADDNKCYGGYNMNYSCPVGNLYYLDEENQQEWCGFDDENDMGTASCSLLETENQCQGPCQWE